MNSEAPRRMSPDFILDRVQLLPGEIAEGYRLGCIDERTIVKLAEDALANECHLPALKELTLLLAADLERVPALVATLHIDVGATEADASRVWLYLVLDWIHAHRAELPDPLGAVEAVYADFGYPAEMEGFVTFMPAPPGEASGLIAIEDRWRSYLDARAREYAQRRTGSPASSAEEGR